MGDVLFLCLALHQSCAQHALSSSHFERAPCHVRQAAVLARHQRDLGQGQLIRYDVARCSGCSKSDIEVCDLLLPKSEVRDDDDDDYYDYGDEVGMKYDVSSHDNDEDKIEDEVEMKLMSKSGITLRSVSWDE